MVPLQAPPRRPLRCDTYLLICTHTPNAPIGHLRTASHTLPPPQLGHIEAAALLIAKGAIVQSRDLQGRTPLHMAAVCEARDSVRPLVKLLVSHGASMRSQDQGRRTPFHAACQAGNLVAMSVMMEEIGVDVHAKDDQGLTPLHLAVAGGHLGVAQYLVDNSDASLAARDNHGRTPLRYAEEAAGRLAAAGNSKVVAVQSCLNFLR